MFYFIRFFHKIVAAAKMTCVNIWYKDKIKLSTAVVILEHIKIFNLERSLLKTGANVKHTFKSVYGIFKSLQLQQETQKYSSIIEFFNAIFCWVSGTRK